ncbi:MAG: SusC/RagA family protein [Bacteroidetes bacterium GWD2_45_23]|nr:MAG: SusC/RagA family protein [Bacteroidetes bacterium GWC2_46_850]OFX82238.1 MAG: SusC/RagA family protein [Bacteroidetes bacterium GWC1_47_7]OFX87554.1 MAG: SusC/RagA family protein [Bacteroidetes bacterium GWD2_45_23]HAR38689.1 SusC/RagA family protein [Porphyromonadaceae bacterium]HBB01495.1 SusC/RagA family protein [Porphyromonadaceae bacterium]
MNEFSMKKKVSIGMLLFLFFSLGLTAQEKNIRGSVKDTYGEPVIGANVMVKGTSIGAATDINGNYTLSAPASATTLQISYIGMKETEVAITGSVVNIVMEEDVSSLDEVVVVGYGTQRRRDLTGSVSSVNAETIAAVPVASAVEAITGKMAGVQVLTTEGSPDAEMRIRVRGGGSITQSNDPLFIVDGFPVSTISDIPPTDIESIDVLKDASSTAIYGSRGANGVVIVTTKSGKAGKLRLSYNAYFGVKKIAKTLDVLSPYDYATWQYELAALQGNDALKNYSSFFGNYQDLDLYRDIPHNDWQDLTFGRTGTSMNHSLSLNGGSDKMTYAFNFSHLSDKAIMEGSDYKRNSMSLKLNNKPNDKITLDFSIRYTDTQINGGGANDAGSTLDTDKRLKYSVIYTPIPLKNLDATAGSNDDDLGNLYNPLVSITDNAREKTQKRLNLAGSASWEIIDNLRLRSEAGLDHQDDGDQRYWGLTTYYIKNYPSVDNQGKPAIRLVNRERQTLRNTNTLSYDFKKILSEDHSLNLMAGHEYIVRKGLTLTDEVHGFPATFTADDAWRLSSQGVPYTIDNYYNEDDKLLSYFGRANYDFQGKYLLSATFRADASSKFSKENRWGYFPSAAAAWRISSEPFMENTKSWLDDLKLRASFGTAGNNNIPSGQLVQMFESRATSWINGFTNYWAPSKVMANPNLKWETTVTRNVGLDFTLLGGRLSGTVEAYRNTTSDLLIEFPVAGTGYDTQYRNMGENQNQGIETTLNWYAVNNRNFTLSLSGNIGFNRTEIQSLGIMNDFGYDTYWASSEIGYDYWIAKGGAVGQMFGYHSDGRYEVSDFERYNASANRWILKEGVADASGVVGNIRPGSMKLKDLDDNGIVNVDDREIIGDANPVHTGGFTINSTFHGFDISAAFNWSYGNDIYNANKIEFSHTGKYQYRNMITTMEPGKRWTNLREDGTISNDPQELAAMNTKTTMWSPQTSRMLFSDWAVEDGSFLRLNTLTLGYTIPKTMLAKMKIDQLRFYVTGYNVFLWTNYSGYDPEVSTVRRTNLSPGVDYSAYPKSRQLVFGVNLNF